MSILKLKPILPVKGGDKAPPLLSDWQNATPEELKQACLKHCRKRSVNLGLRLDHYLVLDPDDEKAVGLLEELEREGILPETLTWLTWRGYPIRCYLAKEGVVPKKWHNDLHLELRTGKGQYCLIPPSVVNGNAYRLLNDAPPAYLPQVAIQDIENLVGGVRGWWQLGGDGGAGEGGGDRGMEGDGGMGEEGGKGEEGGRYIYNYKTKYKDTNIGVCVTPMPMAPPETPETYAISEFPESLDNSEGFITAQKPGRFEEKSNIIGNSAQGDTYIHEDTKREQKYCVTNEKAQKITDIHEDTEMEHNNAPIGEAAQKEINPVIPMVRFKQGARNDSLFAVALSLFRAGHPPANVEATLRVLAEGCNPPLPPNQLPHILRSAYERSMRRERSLAAEVRDWIEGEEGVFHVNDLDRELNIVTKTQKHNRKVIVQRLVAEGLVVKEGRNRGVYRRVMDKVEVMDFLKTANVKIDLCWPFNLERYIYIYRKNLIVVAGAPNAGKTALLLNLVHDNMGRPGIPPFRYLSSEMGPEELRVRLERFQEEYGTPLDAWKSGNKPIFFERSHDFIDVIHPDWINIIDYYEIGDAFYNIGDQLAEIANRLNKGIAIVALQKTPNADMGRGGSFGLEKPRLYLNMDAGILTIRKAKNWADKTVNPNYLTFRFKLVGGCKFIQQGKAFYKMREGVDGDEGSEGRNPEGSF